MSDAIKRMVDKYRARFLAAFDRGPGEFLGAASDLVMLAEADPDAVAELAKHPGLNLGILNTLLRIGRCQLVVDPLAPKPTDWQCLPVAERRNEKADVCAMNCETCLRSVCTGARALREESSKVLKCESSKVEEFAMAERKRGDRRLGLVMAYLLFLLLVSPAAVAAGRAWPWMAHVYDLAFWALIASSVFVAGVAAGKRLKV